MRSVSAVQIRYDLKANILLILSIKGSFEQFTVASSLKTIAETIFNGPDVASNLSLRMSCPPQGLLYPYLNY